MASVLANRVKFSTSTTGTGTLTVGAAVSNAFCTPAEAGVTNGDVVTYTIEDGADFEVGRGTYSSTGPALSRDTVLLSKISGTAGTSKLTLSGAATVFLTAAAEDIDDKQDAATAITQGKHTIWIPASGMVPGATTGPTSTYTEFSNGNRVQTLDFDQTSFEAAFFQIAMPKSWNKGNLSWQPYWTAASGSGGVSWAIGATAVSNDDTLNFSTITSASGVDDTFIAANDLHIGSEGVGFTPVGSPANDDLVCFRVRRDPTQTADTLTADAKLIGVKLFYTVNAGDDS